MHYELLIALLLGWLLDLCLGDPARLPHPIVLFGRAIAACERSFNQGVHRKLKGAVMAIGLIFAVFLSAVLLGNLFLKVHVFLFVAWNALVVFYCLAGTTLIREVRAVFLALDRSLDEGRRQVARIVGRDTCGLSAQEVRTAALETLAENLSDGVVAPILWFTLLGAPGMLAYKMVNTLDSMIGYRTERFRDFGCWAAHIDDVANYIPARLTALLMAAASPFARISRAALHEGADNSASRGRRERRLSLLRFIARYGRCHASPNSGYPEAALAGILDCRFGGSHYYFGQLFDKPFIGKTDRLLSTADMITAVRVNRYVETAMVTIAALVVCFSPL